MSIGIWAFAHGQFLLIHVLQTFFFCTQLKPGETLPYTEDDLYQALYNRGKAIKNNIKSVTEEVISNFTDPDISWNYPFETRSQQCALHVAVGYLVGKYWYLQNLITEANKNIFIRDRQRVIEYARVRDGKLSDNLLMCLPQRPEEGGEHVLKNGATTIIMTWTGNEAPSSFSGDATAEANEALLPSLQKADAFVQQAQDVLTPSNIAILVLPMVLNLLPISLFAEVSTFKMFLYTVMSDVLTVLPLGIKGVELIKIGSQRHRTVKVRMTTPFWTGKPQPNLRVDASGAEIHGAECRAHNNILPAGVAFLTAAIVFLVGGVAAEFVARHYRMKWKKRRLTELTEFQSAGGMAWGNRGYKHAQDDQSDVTDEESTKVKYKV